MSLVRSAMAWVAAAGCVLSSAGCAGSVTPDQAGGDAVVPVDTPALDGTDATSDLGHASDVRDAAFDAREASTVECTEPSGLSWECFDRYFVRTIEPRNLAVFRCCAGRCVFGTACPQPEAGLPAQCGSEARECDRDAGEACCMAHLTGTRCYPADSSSCLRTFP